ncbi:MAG: WYL domain-containing protein [Bacteriovoracaceae bacterium]
MRKLDAKTWNKLKVLGAHQGAMKLKDLAHELDLAVEDTLTFLRQMFPEGKGAIVYEDQGEGWVDFSAGDLEYMLPVSPSEFTFLQGLLEKAPVSSFEDPSYEILKKKLHDNGPLNTMMQILDQIGSWDQEISAQDQALVDKLDHAVKSRDVIALKTNDEKAYTIYCCKVLHLEGQLTLIAEDFSDHCLMVIPLHKIISCETISRSGTSRVTNFEIEEFIAAVRSMNERETRLILKIYNPQAVNLFPDHHFLGKPCMVTNPEGDLIWAAYVEPCHDLFEWVFSLAHHVEILDPTQFKEQYFAFLEEKMRKVA